MDSATFMYFILAVVVIAAMIYHSEKIAPYKKIVDGLMDIYNLNESIGLKFYRLRVFHALLIYRHITLEQKPEVAKIVLSKICKTPWMKKFLKEDLGIKKRKSIDEIGEIVRRVKLPSMKSCGDQIASFIQSPSPFDSLKEIIIKIGDLKSKEETVFLSPDDIKTLRYRIAYLDRLDTIIVFNHFFGFNHPFGIYEDSYFNEFFATEEMLKNALMNYVTKYPTPCMATIEVSPNTKGRALYRERALRSGKMLIEIKGPDELCQSFINGLSAFKNDIDHENINSVLSLFSYLGMNVVLEDLNPIVINPKGEKQKSFLVDNKFCGEELFDELSKIKVDDMSFNTKTINCSHPMTPNKVSVVLQYSRIGRVYKKTAA